MSTLTQLICHHFGGIRQKNAVFSEEIITAKDVQNVELYYTGINNGVGLRTVKGNTSINDELVGEQRVVEIFESTQQGQKFFFVYAEGGEAGHEKGTLYELNKLTKRLSVIKDNLSVTGAAQGTDVTQGWSDLFFFTNGAEMFTVEKGIVSADTIVDMTPQDPDGRNVLGLGCAVFANRLFIFNGNILWYSVQENIYDFATTDAEWETSAGYIELLKNITAIHPYLGTLAIFYRDSSCLLNVENGTFAISEESPAGCAGINSLVFHDTNLYFYDDTKKAVFSFQQVISGQKTLGENIAIDIQDILLDIDETRLNEIKTLSVFLEGRNEIWWLLPMNESYDKPKTIYAYVYDTHTIYADSSTNPTTLYNVDGTDYTGMDWTISSGTVKYGENDAIYTENSNKEIIEQKAASIVIIYDYLKGEWIKRKCQKINAITIFDNELYSGAEDGNILEEYSSETFNGDYIQHYYNCSACNLGAMNTLKVLVFQPRVSFDFPYTNTFYVKYVKNYNNFKKPKIKQIKSKIKNYLFWDIGHWDVNYWADRNTNIIGKFPNATFKVLEISMFTTKLNENFAIKNIEFSKIKVKQV